MREAARVSEKREEGKGREDEGEKCEDIEDEEQGRDVEKRRKRRMIIESMEKQRKETGRN